MMMAGRCTQHGGVQVWTLGDMNAAVKGINMSLAEVTLAEALHAAGCRKALSGKWHLGARPEHGPKEQAFDEFFASH